MPMLPFSLPGQYPGMSPNDVGNRVAFAVQGMTPFGTDCCNCAPNEEDYRVYPHSAFLQEAGLGISAQLEDEAAAALEASPAEHAELEGLPEGTASFLQAKPQLGWTPYGAGTRQMTNTMGLAPAGIDCCACVGNEEDYRVYPWHGMNGGIIHGGRKGIISPAAGALLPFI